MNDACEDCGHDRRFHGDTYCDQDDCACAGFVGEPERNVPAPPRPARVPVPPAPPPMLPQPPPPDDVPADPRQPGEVLWPSRYGQAYIDTHRANLGPLFEAVWQQRPFPLGGNLFKEPWFRGRFKTNGPMFELEDGSLWPFSMCPRFTVIDPATGKDATKGDFTAIGSFACIPAHTPPMLLVLGIARDRYPLEDLLKVDSGKNILAQEVARWKSQWVEFEATGFQVTCVRLARQCLTVPVREVPTEGKSKLVRALPAIARAEAGQILFPSPDPPWLAGFVREHCEWSGDDGDVDDQIDCLTYAVRRFDTFGFWSPRSEQQKVAEERELSRSNPDREDDNGEGFVRQRLDPRTSTRGRALFGG